MLETFQACPKNHSIAKGSLYTVETWTAKKHVNIARKHICINVWLPLAPPFTTTRLSGACVYFKKPHLSAKNCNYTKLKTLRPELNSSTAGYSPFESGLNLNHYDVQCEVQIQGTHNKNQGHHAMILHSVEKPNCL
ncbi:endo-1,4-beta-xylanase [Acrasis kona]|uniref:Endo-1,4-beta-xylanase n=1 Tax=Acrasis kona TaxID=1008807 RepID=A0AAW2Z3Q8_9EUKA